MSDPQSLVQVDDETMSLCVDAGLQLHALKIDPAWREAVTANLRATANAAALVMSFRLDDDLDAGPVFTP
ncbi:MAG: 1-carboxybiuret hydrolase subunit AtzG-like [Variibacter sp.]|nr:1-carboxybiuret hydrolase subunit AtzG-like [Variibacter sp.]